MVEMPIRIEEGKCSLLKQKIPILFTFYSIADDSFHRSVTQESDRLASGFLLTKFDVKVKHLMIKTTHKQVK